MSKLNKILKQFGMMEIDIFQANDDIKKLMKSEVIGEEKESHYGDCVPRDDCEKIQGHNQHRAECLSRLKNV